MIYALDPHNIPAGSKIVAPAVLDMSILHKSPGGRTLPWADQCKNAAVWLASQPADRRFLSVQWLFGWAQDNRDCPWGECKVEELIDKGVQGHAQWGIDYRALGQFAQACRNEGVFQIALAYTNVESGIGLGGRVFKEAKRRINSPTLRMLLPANVGSITPQSLLGQYEWDGPGYFEAAQLWNQTYMFGMWDAAIFSACRPLAKFGPVLNSPGGYAGGMGQYATFDYNGWGLGDRQGIPAPQLFLQMTASNGTGAKIRLGVDTDPRWLNLILSANILRSRPGAIPVLAGPQACGVSDFHLQSLCAVAADAGVGSCIAFNVLSAEDTGALERAASIFGPAFYGTLPAIPWNATEIKLRDRTIHMDEYLQKLPQKG